MDEPILSGVLADLNAIAWPERPEDGLWMPALPAPGADGLLPTRDGRVYRVRDPAALAAALTAQEPRVRVDRDHQSERAAPNFTTTAAEGWCMEFRAEEDGSIQARVELSSYLRWSLRAREYLYSSPALWLDDPEGDRNVTGMSSVAMVNDPNMPTRAPAINNPNGPGGDVDENNGGGDAPAPADLQAREAAIDEFWAERRNEAVEEAIANGHVPAASRDYHLAAMAAGDDPAAAIKAFRSAVAPGDPAAPGPAELTARTAPRNAAHAERQSSAAFDTPANALPASRAGLERLAAVQQLQTERNCSFREAVDLYAAEQRGGAS